MKKIILLILIILNLTSCTCQTSQIVSAPTPAPEIIYIEIEKEVIVEKEVIIEVEYFKPVFDVTLEERELLAELIYYEARGEKFPTQTAIVSVVFNRLRFAKEGTTISDIIFAPNQFSPSKRMDGKAEEITNSSWDYSGIYEAVDYVINYGVTIDEYVTYFRADYYHDWGEDYKPYCIIDKTYFSYKVANYNKWKNNNI